MQLTFVGSGDAFGSGGRFNTCFHVQGHSICFLIDCGASSLIAMKKLGIDRNAIDHILITHFHGDHFGGIPYFMLDAQFFAKRTRPLTIIGPDGLPDWYEHAMEMAFPGSSATKPRFDLELREITPGSPMAVGGLDIIAARVCHGPPQEPFLAYRIGAEGRIIAYTGDTEWTDELLAIGRHADLLIAEAYFYDKKVPLHLDLATLKAKLPLIQPKRLILTHMSDEMLTKLPQISHEAASDGLRVTI